MFAISRVCVALLGVVYVATGLECGDDTIYKKCDYWEQKEPLEEVMKGCHKDFPIKNMFCKKEAEEEVGKKYYHCFFSKLGLLEDNGCPKAGFGHMGCDKAYPEGEKNDECKKAVDDCSEKCDGSDSAAEERSPGFTQCMKEKEGMGEALEQGMKMKECMGDDGMPVDDFMQMLQFEMPDNPDEKKLEVVSCMLKPFYDSNGDFSKMDDEHKANYEQIYNECKEHKEDINAMYECLAKNKCQICPTHFMSMM